MYEDILIQLGWMFMINAIGVIMSVGMLGGMGILKDRPGWIASAINGYGYIRL